MTHPPSRVPRRRRSGAPARRANAEHIHASSSSGEGNHRSQASVETKPLKTSTDAVTQLADDIIVAAKKRKESLLAEDRDCKNKYRHAAMKLDRSKKKLETLQSKLSYWEVKLAEAEKDEKKAFAFRNDAMARTFEEGRVKKEGGGPTFVFTAASICEDVMHVVMSNATFAQTRVDRLKESGTAQQEVVVSVEDKLQTTKRRCVSRSVVLRTEISELDALLHFLGKPK
ncbi:hypothetical protein M758_UG040100 [Ceratodon purpureus]|nr:hypothetical protein M758_UG040100 [Ceratodon purpureus]